MRTFIPFTTIKKSFSYVGVALLFLTGPHVFAEEIVFSGKTMGTTYHITIAGNLPGNPEYLKSQIDKRLDAINQSMSPYIKDSEISRFNQLEAIDTPFSISSGFLKVMMEASSLYKETKGAWDGTVAPLVNLWGFGTGPAKGNIPSDDAINALRKESGFDLITISEEGYLKKKSPRVTLDLSSIAKGYGVDDIAGMLKQNDIDHFLVEIGGEVYASGKKENNELWRVGINTPKKEAPVDQVYKTVLLSNKAMATSGDYRNFFERDGKRYSHIIDPKTGYPIGNSIVSVSVLADSCMVADGLATGIMVMGRKKGIALINRLKNIECLIITLDKSSGSLLNYYSTGFKRYLLKKSKTKTTK
jgi:thiamine biosynthesis lipoprotein